VTGEAFDAVAAASTVRFRRRQCDGWTVLSATGDLDAAGTSELKRELDLALADGLLVIVDITHARLVDDSASELLAGMGNLLQAFGGRLSTISAG
jgi:anti-anti-sigma regulatory factor